MRGDERGRLFLRLFFLLLMLAPLLLLLVELVEEGLGRAQLPVGLVVCVVRWISVRSGG